MILLLMIAVPLVGGVAALIAGIWGTRWVRWVSILTMLANTALGLATWFTHFGYMPLVPQGMWLEEFRVAWIPPLGISFHLAMDGLGFLLAMLTNILTLLGIWASWRSIQYRVGFFHLMLLWNAAALIGAFWAIDLFLFYFFFELMLMPVYFLIVIWGHEKRIYAAIKFFIFTQISGLLMLVAILGLYFAHGRATGVYTFDYMILLQLRLPTTTTLWLMFGFLAAFAVKLPMVPVHTWLPDAHTQAPTAGSVDLAGLLIKIGAYGMIRFLVPLFPAASLEVAPAMRALAVVTILYGAILAFVQTDLKRLVAYTSVSHMGFVLLGIFSWTPLALLGVIIQLVVHGFSTGAFFILVGELDERIHTREMDRMGGLWETTPRLGGVTLFLALAALGLPGLGNFIADFLILIGSYPVSPAATILAAVGLILSMVYALWIIQRVFHGRNQWEWSLPDMSAREIGIMTSMVLVILWLGLYPQPALQTAQQTVNNLVRIVAPGSLTDGAPPSSLQALDRGGKP